MKAGQLGMEDILNETNANPSDNSFTLGRVVAEHRERYQVAGPDGIVDAELTGNLRFSAQNRLDLPVVGDWVKLLPYGQDTALIQGILPRKSILTRASVSQSGEVQPIASNIDVAFIVMAVDHDFNLNRAERYLALCAATGIKPIILLSKTDLLQEEESSSLLNDIHARIHDIPVIAVSNETQDGYDQLREQMERGKTYCLLGSSGVGKSSLLNGLAGKTLMSTSSISTSTNKGRHTTSHRELVLLDNGAIIIDNPGMREVGMAEHSEGLEITFDLIADYAKFCKFKDCTHQSENGCRVREAVQAGEISEEYYENFLRLEREKAFFTSSLEERR